MYVNWTYRISLHCDFKYKRDVVIILLYLWKIFKNQKYILEYSDS